MHGIRVRIRAGIPAVPLGHARYHRSFSAVLVAEGFFLLNSRFWSTPSQSKTHCVLFLWLLVCALGDAVTPRVWLQSLWFGEFVQNREVWA